MRDFFDCSHLKLAEDAKKIRAVIANEKITGGTRILYTKAAITPVLFYSDYTTRCHFCLKQVKLFQCSQCKRAYYCSRTCQRDAWTLEHKHICRNKLWQSVEYDLDSEILRRWLLVDKAADIEIFNSLPHHMDKVNSSNYERYYATAYKIHELVPETRKHSVDYLAQTISRFHCNDFSVNALSSNFLSFAHGIYPVMSLLNHSCMPNAIVRFGDMGHAVLMALEDIEAGQEVTISYLDSAQTTLERKRQLLENYYFNCECLQCVLPSDEDQAPYSTISRECQKEFTLRIYKTVDFSNLYSHTSNAYNELWQQAKVKVKGYCQCENRCYRNSILEILKRSTSDFHDLAAVNDWEAAQDSAEFIAAVYLLIYPRRHNLVWDQIWTTSKCMWNAQIMGGGTKATSQTVQLAIDGVGHFEPEETELEQLIASMKALLTTCNAECFL